MTVYEPVASPRVAVETYARAATLPAALDARSNPAMLRADLRIGE
jgi:hypothetical protein